jgi:hypothetical protein
LHQKCVLVGDIQWLTSCTEANEGYADLPGWDGIGLKDEKSVECQGFGQLVGRTGNTAARLQTEPEFP